MREKIRTMDPQKRRRAVVLASVLVVLLAIGATLAYLSATTDERQNAFSFADNVKGILEEPNWDPKKGEDLTPGAEIPKDPFIRNVSDNGVDVWAGIRVGFTDGHGDLLSDDPGSENWVGRLLRLIDIDWNTDDWELVGASNGGDPDMALAVEQVWAYMQTIEPGEPTTPLFNRVVIKPAFTDEDFDLYGDDLDWDTEYAWLSSMVMDHTDSCYVPSGACDCDQTWRHHTMCAIYGEAGSELVGPGGMLGTETCDCMPTEIHESGCPAVTYVIPDPAVCDHTGDGIDGFYIIVRGAVVQAYVDGMDAWVDPDKGLISDALVSLFEANPYDGLTVAP